ncbi:cytosolic phospholipase A2 gamma-like protein [Labeo rohita]|uniref:Cytosolic phospholipase A2 gamma-like protein n=1 Tax=Labeo rohita TaxID=84645 RepID=A0A498NR39_LABRO|nr:cytosolic phospholipase A2 gamma-like protein [Labeo rohita]
MDSSSDLKNSLQIDELTLTDHWDHLSKDPFPIYTAIDKQCKKEEEKGGDTADPWFEISPYEADFFHYLTPIIELEMFEEIRKDPNEPSVCKCYRILMDLVDVNLAVLNGTDPFALDQSIRKTLKVTNKSNQREPSTSFLKNNNLLAAHVCTIKQNEVPHIALLGSGGGQRAMVGLLGSLVELDKVGLLDCILYLSGVSGSTWCMASLYKEPDWSTKLETMKDKIIKRLNGPEVSWGDAYAKLKKYYKKDNFSLTDVWAVMIITEYVKEIDEQKLTDQWDQLSKDPFPIYTAIDKQCKQKEDGDPWFEISPHEADPRGPPEEMYYQVLMELVDMNLCVLNGEDPSGLDRSIRKSLNDLFLSICRCMAWWIWGRNYNFLHKMRDEAVPVALLKSNMRDYEDAGLLLNSPYFSVLREERHIDLIISLDFSNGDPFMTVTETAEMCKKLNIPFPEVNIPREDVKKPKDFYVFKGQNAPTVIHIPLFNVVNYDVETWRNKYATFQRAYSAEMITDLMEIAGKNILNNREKLLEQIRAVVGGEVRISHSLNTKEKEFVDQRREIVFQSLNKLNIHCSKDAVPNIALLGSGGGQRAMVGLLGSLVQLNKAGLLDCILYLSGVSGSTCWGDASAKLKKYYYGKDYFSLTDVWAVIAVTTYVKEIDEHKLSEQRDQHSKDLFPIYTVIDKQCKQCKDDKDSWFEVSLHEAGYSLTGAFVGNSSFGSQFDNGSKKKPQDEMDMLYLQALCGSALADGLEILKFLWEKIKDFFHIFFQSGMFEEMNKELSGGEHQLIFPTGKLDPADKEAAKLYMKQYTEDVCNYLTLQFSFWPFNCWMSICRCMVQWLWGRNYNFLHNVKDEVVPAALQESEMRDHEDAGLLLNSPYFSVLRKERNTNLIISLDFSEGDPFMTVRDAAETCKKLNIPFPEVSIPSEDVKKPKDFYVFKGKDKTPTVIHIPLFNVVNYKLETWRENYRTFQGAYSAEMITDLMEVAGKNISNNTENLKKQIQAVVG